MPWEDWNAVDEYITELIVPEDAGLQPVAAANSDAGLPAIDVSPPQAKLLNLLARMVGARRVLEFGTLGGYSTIWLARALPDDGKVVTLEAQPDFAAVAAANVRSAGCEAKVEIRVGDAHATMPALIDEAPDPFDFVFIDADKPSNPEYFSWALSVTRPGSVIVVDNVVRDGAIVSNPDDPGARGSRELHALIAAEPRVSATSIQTVGSKGWDGFTIALVQ
jgi:predicted O-methyltransferase YrrM